MIYTKKLQNFCTTEYTIIYKICKKASWLAGWLGAEISCEEDLVLTELLVEKHRD